jgi:CRISPR-associated protein Csd1
MLHELVNYVEKHGLRGLPGYKAKQARWLIVLTEDGQFVDVVASQREHPMAPHLELPELIGGGTARSHFLLDSLAVVTGYGGAPDAKIQQKHANFVTLLRQASTDCPELAWCADVLDDAGSLTRINSALEAHKAKPTDTVTFQVGTTFVPEMVEWRPWWQAYRTSLRGATGGGGAMICFVTGKTVTPAPTHAKITGLSQVGGQPSGSLLISFDKEAFGSYGLEQSANAACSEEAVALYRSALQDLVGKAPRPLGGMLMLHWYDRPIQDEDDPLLLLLGDYGDAAVDEASASEKARKVLSAVREGKRPELTQNRYFVMQIAGAGGRITVRDWFNGDFTDLVANVNRWYDDLEIVNPYGDDLAPPTKLAGLLTRLVAYRPGEKGNDTFKRVNEQLGPLTPRLWRAILQGGPLPDSAAQAALVYARSKLLRGADAKKEDARSADNLDRVACAILKAWLVRRAPTEKGRAAMAAKVNKEHPSPAYQAGRLLAVLAAVQNTALGDVGAGVVQRYYASASATPALVVGRLMRNAQYHIQKIDSKGLAYWYEQQIAEIATKLGDGLPATLSLEGQTLFALGYYQQKAEMMGGKVTDGSNSTNGAAPNNTPEEN